MPKKRKKNRRSTIPRRTPRPQPNPDISNPDAPGPPAPSQRDEMRENESNIEISGLTHRQQTALPAVALYPSVSAAARVSGIGESTLYRWLAEPAFRQQVERFRLESAESLRAEVRGIMLRSLSVMSEAMTSPDEAIRLRAARYAMSSASRIHDVEQIRADLQILEGAVESAKANNS